MLQIVYVHIHTYVCIHIYMRVCARIWIYTCIDVDMETDIGIDMQQILYSRLWKQCIGMVVGVQFLVLWCNENNRTKNQAGTCHEAEQLVPLAGGEGHQNV